MQKWFSLSVSTNKRFGLRFLPSTWAWIINIPKWCKLRVEHVILSAESENSAELKIVQDGKEEEREREREREKRDGFPGLIFRQLRAKRLVIFSDNEDESEEKPVSCFLPLVNTG